VSRRHGLKRLKVMVVRSVIASIVSLGLIVPAWDLSHSRAWAVAAACEGEFVSVEPQQVDGTGPYLVASEEQLTWISKNQDAPGVLGRQYLQTRNLNLGHCEWAPIGAPAKPFAGTYDGGGFEIQSFSISSGYSAALFRQTAETANISNLVLRSVTIASGESDIAAIVGNNFGLIENVAVSGSILLTGNGSGAAGVAAYNDTGGTIRNAVVELSILAETKDRNQGYIGGVVGYNSGTVESSRASVTIEVGGSDVGGLAGFSEGSISDSSASGFVTGENQVGGLVGWNDGVIESSSSSGVVTGAQQSDHIYGGGDYVGGLVGYSEGTISSSRSTSVVSGSSWGTGGLVGYAEGVITTSSATGAVTGEDAVGGLVGGNWADVSRSFASGPVTASRWWAGGLVGAHYGTIVHSYASGPVQGAYDVGGLVGEGYGKILDSYARGSATGEGRVGGLVGCLDYFNTLAARIGAYTPILRAYSTGLVTGDSLVGGLVGAGDCDAPPNDEAIALASFWDTISSDQNVSAGGTGANGSDSASLKTIGTYTAASIEWPIVAVSDFGEAVGPSTEIWAIAGGINDGYPFLWWEEEPETPDNQGGSEEPTKRLSSRESSSGSESDEQRPGMSVGAMAPGQAPESPERFTTLRETGTPLAESGADTPPAPDESLPFEAPSSSPVERYLWVYFVLGLVALGGIGIFSYLRMRPRPLL
jgi:hypothetical protein